MSKRRSSLAAGRAARLGVDPTRRWARLACRCSPATPVDGSAHFYASRPVRTPRLVATCGEDIAPVRGLARRFAVDRVPWRSRRAPCVFPTPRLDDQASREGLEKPEKACRSDFSSRHISTRSRSRFSAVLPATLAAISVPSRPFPLAQRLHGLMTNLRFHIITNSATFPSETYETCRKAGSFRPLG